MSFVANLQRNPGAKPKKSLETTSPPLSQGLDDCPLPPRYFKVWVQCHMIDIKTLALTVSKHGHVKKKNVVIGCKHDILKGVGRRFKYKDGWFIRLFGHGKTS